jgi:hypothetical protein
MSSKYAEKVLAALAACGGEAWAADLARDLEVVPARLVAAPEPLPVLVAPKAMRGRVVRHGSKRYLLVEAAPVSLRERGVRLARALGLTPTERTRVERDSTTRAWWLLGCVEGGQPLPGARDEATLSAALEAAEAWFAPELGS